MKKLLILLLFISSLNAFAATYYVATTGSNGNAGTFSSPWATLTYAASTASPVTAGDVVYVAAGSYTGTVTFEESGTFNAPISYIGYTTTPGDQPTLLVNNTNPYAAYSSSVMPTYTGASRSTGTCFDMEDSQYITVKNFQITNYSSAVFMGGTTPKVGIGLYNVNCMALGNITTSDYDGFGIRMGVLSTKFANYNLIKSCLVVNAAAEGINVCGDYNIIEDCKVYSNSSNDTIGSDYFITLQGSYNIVKYCKAEQNTAGPPYGTHGFTIKGNASQVIDDGDPYDPIKPTWNKFLYCTVRNIGEGFTFRHRWVTNNLAYGCTAIGTHTGSSGSSGDGNGACFRDGASYNIVDKMTVDSCYAALEFVDTVEDGDTGGSPPGHPGNGNKFINSKISNCYFGVLFSENGVASDAGDNLISNCSFYLTRIFFYCGRRCTTMNYKNNIFYGNFDTGQAGNFRSYTYSSDVTGSQFVHNVFYKMTNGMPGGFVESTTGGLTSDPLYVNVTTRDLHLQSGSPCIDAATTIVAETRLDSPTCHFSNPNINNVIWIDNNKQHIRNVPHATFDFDGKKQPTGAAVDIGCYEY